MKINGGWPGLERNMQRKNRAEESGKLAEREASGASRTIPFFSFTALARLTGCVVGEPSQAAEA
jgi:hypothetical protein